MIKEKKLFSSMKKILFILCNPINAIAFIFLFLSIYTSYYLLNFAITTALFDKIPTSNINLDTINYLRLIIQSQRKAKSLLPHILYCHFSNVNPKTKMVKNFYSGNEERYK